MVLAVAHDARVKAAVSVCVCAGCVCVSFVVSRGAEMFTLSGKNGESKLMMHRTCGKDSRDMEGEEELPLLANSRAIYRP